MGLSIVVFYDSFICRLILNIFSHLKMCDRKCLCLEHNSSIIQLNRYSLFIFFLVFSIFSRKKKTHTHRREASNALLCEKQQQQQQQQFGRLRWCSSRFEFNFLWKLLILCFSRSLLVLGGFSLLLLDASSVAMLLDMLVIFLSTK